jgi:hypothetical protein
VYAPGVDREGRIAKNEAIAREINEGIEEAMSSKSADRSVRMLCECGRPECERVIAISLAEYEDARRDARRFVVVGEHVMPDIETVVEDTGRYVIVQKREGTPAEMADSTDPRD